MPASASPMLTLFSTARTSTSWLTGVAVTPALVKASSAYLPAGTVGAARTRTTSGRGRAARPGIFLGFPGGPREIGESGDLLGVPRRDRDLQPIADEGGRRSVRELRVDDLLHVRVVG